MPRSPSERTIRPTLRAGRSSSEVSRMSTPPCRTCGVKGNRPAVRIHSITSRQPPQVRPVTDLAGPDQAQGPRVGPVDADVLGLARIGYLKPLAGQKSGSQRPHVDVVHARSRTEVDLG